MKRPPDERHKQMEPQLKCFDTHRCLNVCNIQYYSVKSRWTKILIFTECNFDIISIKHTICTKMLLFFCRKYQKQTCTSVYLILKRMVGTVQFLCLPCGQKMSFMRQHCEIFLLTFPELYIMLLPGSCIQSLY